MKGAVVVALCFVFVAFVWARPEEKYTDQYDSVDVDAILQSKRLYTNYLNCIKTGKKCTPDGLKLRELLPDALKTGCSKCTEVQKTQSRKVIRFMAEQKPNDLKAIEDIFDPQHEMRAKFAETLKKEGIVLPD